MNKCRLDTNILLFKERGIKLRPFGHRMHFHPFVLDCKTNQTTQRKILDGHNLVLLEGLRPPENFKAGAAWW